MNFLKNRVSDTFQVALLESFLVWILHTMVEVMKGPQTKNLSHPYVEFSIRLSYPSLAKLKNLSAMLLSKAKECQLI